MHDTKLDQRVEALRAVHDREMTQIEAFHREATEAVDLKFRVAKLTGKPGDKLAQANIDLCRQQVGVQKAIVDIERQTLRAVQENQMSKLQAQIAVEASLAALEAER